MATEAAISGAVADGFALGSGVAPDAVRVQRRVGSYAGKTQMKLTAEKSGRLFVRYATCDPDGETYSAGKRGEEMGREFASTKEG